MKQLIILFSTVFLLLLAATGCTEEERPEVVDSPVVVGSEYAQLNLRIGDIRTRAGNFAADPEEKEIKSLACFVQTFGVGDPDAPEYKPGAFCKYFSTEDVQTDMGMEVALKEESEGVYSVTVRVHSEAFNPDKGSDILFLANYQNTDEDLDLTEDLMKLETWEDLEKMVTKSSAALPTAPLLMFAKTNIKLREGEVHVAEIKLKRIASRIDVEYIEEKDDENDANKFVLESIQVINPKGSSFLQPHDEDAIDELATIASYPAVTPETATPDEIKKIYTYPASNRENTTPTRLRIRGTYTGNLPVDKTIDFMMPDGETSIPLVHNTRYVLQLFPPGDNKELSWQFVIEDWSEGRTIEVSPTQKPIEVKEITFNPDQSSRWDAATRRFDITGITSGNTMDFSVEGNSPTTFQVLCRYDKSGSSIGLTDITELADIVTQEAPEEKTDPDTQAKSFVQKYSIAIPSQAGNAQVPIEVKVLVSDAANPNNADSVVFTSLPDYNGISGLKPVKVAGQYWAPVNVGATTTTSGDNLAFMGYVFQWGRNGTTMQTVATGAEENDIIQGPVSYAKATTDYANNFIANAASDWLIAEDVNKATRNLLWSKNVNDSPCPEGWRVPRSDEFQKIVDAATPGVYDALEMKFTLQGDETGKELVFPLVGWRQASGASSKRGTEGSYSTASYTAGNKGGWFYIKRDNSVEIGYGDNAVARPLRCIQE